MDFVIWNIEKFDNCFIVQSEESKMEKLIGLSPVFK